ncbi:hypothetical protein RirG_020610 [Rhizophagus irregularis DAOM 197198w]|uniref:TLDc domain-containing protein n=1 Tax=Rhizophagus irregularis (strain DAOM 197198w) TaxID=1432141 RepID=A0A015K7U2_RHIIW|nr:hypothetical protein RirG_020610 [Rhizophagus irregularis DAOM 197198w]
MAKSPEKVFKSLDFISLPEESLVSLIKRDDLQMKEVEVWDHVLKWGLEKNPTLLPDPTTWSDDDFKMMTFLSSDELVQKIRPYKKLLNDQLYEELIYSYLDSNSKPNDNILLPRYRNIDGIIDSKIVNLNIVSLVSRWIDKIDIKSKYTYTREFYLPYKFKLLLRGSRNGFTPESFHELCDNKPCTLTLIKVKGTEEIIGGYNPTIWKSPGGYGEYGKTKDSFIFSFKSKDNFKDPILSYVKNYDQAFFYGSSYGPTFDDLDIYVEYEDDEDEDDKHKNYNFIRCVQRSYEKKIRDTEDEFLIDDYEVFQILERDY